MEMKPLSGRRRAYDRILRFLLYFCAALTCALLLFIIGYIFFKGLPHVTWQFLSTQPSFIKDTIGILPNILNTVYLVGVTLIITLPLGVGAAIYLTEYARNRRLVAAIEFATGTSPASLHHLRPGGHALFCQLLGLQASPAGRLADSGDRHHPSHHPHHPGVPQDRPSVLPGRAAPGLGRGASGI